MKKVINFTMLFALCMLLNSCIAAMIGGEVAGGKQTQFSGKYELPLKETNEKTIGNLRKTLLELGFISSSNTLLNFAKDSGNAEMFGLNKFYSTKLDAEISENKVIINILQTGNYQYGTEQKTNETFEKIKIHYLK